MTCKNCHTPKQIENWKRYEEVRLYGRWNMYTPQAIEATGLTKEEYRFCMQNYSTLKEQAIKK